mgnify:CR=1 FL=1
MKTHYELLAVEPTADADTIKKAFRREIARYHPDKVIHLGAEFQEMAATRAAELIPDEDSTRETGVIKNAGTRKAQPEIDAASDEAAKAAFGDLVVEKRLARTLAARYGVPNFVAEFIVAQYCSSDDPSEVAEGLKLAESDLSSKIIKPSEQQTARYEIATTGACDLIDQVSVTVDAHSSTYSAAIKAVGEKVTVPIPGGPGNTTAALTRPGVALAGRVNVAET